MSYFIFKAKRGPGEVLNGNIEAESELSAITRLSASGYSPISIKEVPPRVADPAAAGTIFFRKISHRAIADFTRQLSELLNSGLTLFDSLLIIEDEAQVKGFREVIKTIRSRIKEGDAFSESLKFQPCIFSNLYVSLVKSGETGGMLNDVLSNISDLLEKQENVKARLISAMLYPALMAGVGVATVFALMVFVIPRLARMFSDMGQALPFSTRFLIGLSAAAKDYWALLIILIAVFLFLIKRAERHNIVKNRIDRVRLKIPVFGRLLKDTEFERFTRTLSALLKNSVPMLHALKISIGTISNEAIKADLGNVCNEVSAGSSFAEALRKSQYVAHYMVTMVIIGEEGGILDKTLLRVAQGYESMNDRLVKRLSSLLEPVMILVMGLLVGFIVVSMLLPIFQISMSVR